MRECLVFDFRKGWLEGNNIAKFQLTSQICCLTFIKLLFGKR